MTTVEPVADGTEGGAHGALAVAGLARLAAGEPDAPWLIFRSGFDWKWRGAASALAAIVARAESLAHEHLPGQRLGFRWTPEVAAVELDLAIRLAGCVAAPDAALHETAAHLVPDRDAATLAAPPVAPVEREPPRAAGALVADAAGSAVVDAAALAAAARELLERLDLGRERPVVVLARSPRAAGERLVLAAAVDAGAAIVLAEPETLAGTLAWARPHLLHGTASELLAVGPALRDVKRRWRRVRGVVVLGETPLPPAECRAWEGAGAVVIVGGELLTAAPAVAKQ